MFDLKKIVKRNENFADWYTSIIHNAQMCVYGQIKGTIIFQPNAWFIWDSIRKIIDNEFAKIGVLNLAMPTLISQNEFAKEKKHLEGFAPECFTVTKIGNKELDDHYFIRPTSEIIFCNYFSYVVSSYKNLPLKVNQWCSVMRAEKTTRPFLRNSEFHWQELHAVFENKIEATKFTKKVLDIYEKLMVKFLCIPVIKGEKTVGERFAGANNTYTLEGLMQDGQMLQCGTSHFLGQNFSKIFNIKYQNKENKFDYVYQMSAGISTRLLGAIIMVHADDSGLVLPPDIAPKQIVINLVGHDKEPQILKIANDVKKQLRKFRVFINDSNHGLGYKLSDGEVNGIPIQIIIGKETLSSNTITYIRRDEQIKKTIDLKDLVEVIKKEIDIYKNNLFNRANKQLNESIVEVDNIDDLKKVVDKKQIAKVYWAGNEQDEAKIKELTGATARCIIDKKAKESICFFTKKKTKQIVIFGRAY